jgi:hypothetical protein
MSRTDAQNFRDSVFLADKLPLPEEITARFYVMECLSEKERGNTYLLTEKDGEAKYVLKCHKKSETSGASNEAELMRGLSHKGLPKYAADYDDGNTVFILREYAEGVPLDEYFEEYGREDTALIVKIALELCDILSYLHSQQPPIIHRDIKHSNIIIDPDAKSVKLIDFGISRRYSETSDTDTEYFGTKKYSPPEQYGYAQTDSRSDIYAVGVLLRFMLTGDFEGEIQDKELARIVKKCTDFAPKARYQNADALSRALSEYTNRSRNFVVRAVVCAAALILMVLSCVLIYQNTDIFRGSNAETAYVFADPLVEQAARAALGKTDGESVYREELGSVFSLFFLADYAVADSEQYWEYNSTLEDYRVHAELNDISDLTYMENLTELVINGQTIASVAKLSECTKLRSLHLVNCPNISDISVLTGLSGLENFEIVRCGVSDLTPITEWPALRSLVIIDLPLSDYSVIEQVENLRSLAVVQMPMDSLSELGELDYLESLILNVVPISNLDGIERFPALTSLTITNSMRIEDFSPLDSLSGLRELTVSANLEPYVAATMTREDIQVTFQ